MNVSDEISFYGEDVINNLFDIIITMTREQSITPSFKTLSEFIDGGISWWAPIPDNRFKNRDGRDLNLEVICSMMVRQQSSPYYILLHSLNMFSSFLLAR